jgi:hypothetical protein
MRTWLSPLCGIWESSWKANAGDNNKRITRILKVIVLRINNIFYM